MSLDTHQAFQEQVFRALGFAPAPCAFGTRWSNAAQSLHAAAATSASTATATA